MPVTVTVTLPVAAKLQDSVDVPDPPVIDVGVNVHAVLPLVSATAAVNALRGEIVMVEVPGLPTTTITVVGLAEMLKSGAAVIVNTTVAVWLRVPLEPVNMTVTNPVAANVHDRVELPDPPVTEVGLIVHALLLLVSATIPVKLFKGEIVIVDVPGEPTTTVTAVGLAEIVKSGAGFTVKTTVAV